ncbi:MAG TPA: response regulator transcription factor [Planctomycetaceae bacterium]|nr:response regulator transcription factor [Planctomycetaceae bacterium]
MKRILIVEDEAALAEGLKFNFEQEGYDVLQAADGPTAIDLVRESDPPIDIIILDLMLPSMSGYEVCRKVREFDPAVPILVLSARTLSEDKTLAFESGTDQYMTKPFALPELIARVKNLIERRPLKQGSPSGQAPQVFKFGDVTVDFLKYQLITPNEVYTLTTMEMELMKYFVTHPDVVLSRTRILRDVWEETADITSRSIDNFVLRLRRMFEPDPSEPRYLVSIRGTGYRFIPSGNASS